MENILMNIKKLKKLLEQNLENRTSEYKRLFHGRGNFYSDFNYLVVDSIDTILFITFFEEVHEDIELELLKLFYELFEKESYKTLILQRRYLSKSPNEILRGSLDTDLFSLENSLKYSINFLNKNIGIFPDMKIGREFIQDISKDKNILNLFAYTCAFSVCAINAGAKQVVNVDMSKGSLSIGRTNHRINNLDTKKVKFLPYNILKSWGRIKKDAPYDIIIIDPPSFQKGSFAATSDYVKIIKRLVQLASEDCIVLSCLNAPELDTSFIKNIFEEHATEFKYIKRLQDVDNFLTNDDQRNLKNLVFKRIKI
jgi:23S rRNA (cytosine1962-C5)-methyltransferase